MPLGNSRLRCCCVFDEKPETIDNQWLTHDHNTRALICLNI